MILKVVCNDLNFTDTHIKDVTIGKSYDVLDIDETNSINYVNGVRCGRQNFLYTIENDGGKLQRYNSKLFIKLEEMRDRKLEQLGI